MRDMPLKRIKAKSLFIETKFLGQSAICALVGRLKVFQMLAAVGNEAEETTTRALVLLVLIQMC